jgi:hypothetical protein
LIDLLIEYVNELTLIFNYFSIIVSGKHLSSYLAFIRLCHRSQENNKLWT